MKRLLVCLALFSGIALTSAAAPTAAADPLTVLVPRGIWITTPGPLGAVKCTYSRASLCVDTIRINGQEATLVEGYTGSCISMAILNSSPMMGCSKSTDLNGTTQLTDFVANIQSFETPCVVEGAQTACRSSNFSLLPNSGQTGQSLITNAEITMRTTPGLGFNKQVGTVVANAKIVSFTPSSVTSDLVKVDVLAPSRNVGQLIQCSWFTVTIDTCALSESTSAMENSLRMYMYTAPLKNVALENDLVEPNPAGVGAYFTTDAQHVGLSSINFTTGRFGVRVSGPHNSSTGALNTSYTEWYWPAAFVDSLFGLLPEQVSRSTVEVNRSTTGSSEALVATFAATPVGVKITATGITFSAPNVGLRRIVTVKKGNVIPISLLVAAAGLKTDPAAKNAKVTLSAKLKKSLTLSNKSIKTLKKGSFEIPFSFKDASKKSITKIVKIVVK
ncbi:hypothetical protein HQ459_09155 [bacterium]|nr:hypothetical protein [bacterium]